MIDEDLDGEVKITKDGDIDKDKSHEYSTNFTHKEKILKESPYYLASPIIIDDYTPDEYEFMDDSQPHIQMIDTD